MTRSESIPTPVVASEWARLVPGNRLTVVKRSPDGSEAARYPGEVVAQFAHEAWVIVHATWSYDRVELDGLAFCPGDELLEWFSPEKYFNAFSVRAPDGQLKGWYANVTYPARLDAAAVPPILSWHDLYVDVVGLPDGAFVVRDEDELAASTLGSHDPRLHAQILGARDELVRRFEQRLPPFADVSGFQE